MEVAHSSLMVVLGAIGNVAGLLSRERTTENSGEIVRGIMEGLSSIPFSTVWKLAEPIFRGVTIDEDTLIEDVNATDYFSEHVDEFYSGLVAGIEGNFPSVFSKVREFLGGFDLPDAVRRKLDETSTG